MCVGDYVNLDTRFRNRAGQHVCSKISLPAVKKCVAAMMVCMLTSHHVKLPLMYLSFCKLGMRRNQGYIHNVIEGQHWRMPREAQEDSCHSVSNTTVVHIALMHEAVWQLCSLCLCTGCQRWLHLGYQQPHCAAAGVAYTVHSGICHALPPVECAMHTQQTPAAAAAAHARETAPEITT